ncbi:MAG TPA: trigger factor [Patescibacteria group bacterium]|nr:trigger factor [Patescibacteria group bacterium]
MAKTNIKNQKKSVNQDFKPIVAKQDDGTIQITFNIPWKTVEENKTKALHELGKDLEIAGFRKGKAPLDKIESAVSRDKLIQQTLSGLLPQMFNEVIMSEKIRPAVFPKFELINAQQNETWQIRATTCQITEFELGNYKDPIKTELASGKIWTPGKNKDVDDKGLSRQEKEQKVINILLKTINFIVPTVLIDEEVNTRLSKLLEQTEKLGLTLDSYLNSIGKTAQSIRSDYKDQSEKAIRLELILEKIAKNESLNVDDKDIDEAIKASHSDPNLKNSGETPEQRSVIRVILQRRKALDFLTSLV